MLKLKDFLIGAAYVLDLGGTLFNYKISSNPALADKTALESDWQQVGSDLKTAISQYEEGLHV